MVASQKEEVFGVFDFISEQKADAFNRLFSSINVIAQKQIVCVSGIPSVFEQLNKVGELPVDIAYFD